MCDTTESRLAQTCCKYKNLEWVVKDALDVNITRALSETLLKYFRLMPQTPYVGEGPVHTPGGTSFHQFLDPPLLFTIPMTDLALAADLTHSRCLCPTS